MRAREALLRGPADLPDDLARLFPVCTPGASRLSVSFDEVLELLHMAGRSLPHAVLMMVPEAWENAPDMDPAKRAFYEFHSALMEPWDGPACVTFTDGTLIGAVLDRNGLRPARWWQTVDGRVVLASEVGVLDIPADQVVRKGRLQPGKMFLVDTAQGRIVERRRGQVRAGRRAAVRRLAARRLHPAGRPAGQRAAQRLRTSRPAPPADVRLHRGGAAGPAAARWPDRRWSRSARWAPTPRWPCCPSGRGCCSTTSASCSRRSPTRRSTRSARSW